MVPYVSADGFHVPTGSWLAIPQLAIMRDEKIYPHAMTFDGFRFVDQTNGISESRFSHPSYDYPFFGGIRHAW